MTPPPTSAPYDMIPPDIAIPAAIILSIVFLVVRVRELRKMR